jgi:hypothetical protein
VPPYLAQVGRAAPVLHQPARVWGDSAVRVQQRVARARVRQERRVLAQQAAALLRQAQVR